MQAPYEKSALIEFTNNLANVKDSMIRLREVSSDTFAECNKKYVRIYTEIEELSQRAYYALTYAESELRMAESEYQAAQRMMEYASDDSDRSKAQEQVSQALMRCSEAKLKVSIADEEVYQVQCKLQRLNTIWEDKGAVARRTAGLIEDKVSNFQLLTNSCSTAIENYINAMEKGDALLKETFSNAMGQSATSAVTTYAEGDLYRSGGVTARLLSKDKVSLSIAGREQEFPYSKQGLAVAYQVAMELNDSEAMRRIKCIFGGLKNPNATTKDATWNVEYMPLIQANIRQSVDKLFSEYVTKEKLELSLEALSFMTQEELSDRYGRGFMKGTLGLNDGEASYIASDIKSPTYDGRVGLQKVTGSHNTKINYAFVTAVHENLHMMSANDTPLERRRGIMVGNDEYSRAMNEAFTEYFTFLSCGGDQPGGGLYPGVYSGYQVLMQEMPVIEKAVGRECMLDAYFNNNPMRIRIAVDELIGAGSWDDMCLASYEVFYQNNANGASGRLVEHLGKLEQVSRDKDLNCTVSNDITLDKTSLMRDLLDQNVNRQHLLADSKVEWDGDKGNSICRIKNDIVIKAYDVTTRKNIEYSGEAFKEIMREKYGQDYVEYIHREPNFEPFEQVISAKEFKEFLSVKHSGKSISIEETDFPGHLELEKMSVDRQNGTFKDANAIIARHFGVSNTDVSDFLKYKGYTWHECGDRKTMRILPREINQVFTHTGGIGIEMDNKALTESIKRTIKGKNMILDNFHDGNGTAVGLQEAVEKKHHRNNEIKKELF